MTTTLYFIIDPQGNIVDGTNAETEDWSMLIFLFKIGDNGVDVKKRWLSYAKLGYTFKKMMVEDE